MTKVKSIGRGRYEVGDMICTCRKKPKPRAHYGPKPETKKFKELMKKRFGQRARTASLGGGKYRVSFRAGTRGRDRWTVRVITYKYANGKFVRVNSSQHLVK
jgi:hypothetical protein